MEEVGVVQFYENGSVEPLKKLVANMTDSRQKLIRLFGVTACMMYGLIAERASFYVFLNFIFLTYLYRYFHI